VNKNINIKDFSKHLFWDVNISEIDFDKHKKFIIKKTLQFGLYNDWQLIVKLYDIKKIAEIATKIRDLDIRTANFISIISDTPLNKFICCTTKQSIPKHWNF